MWSARQGLRAALAVAALLVLGLPASAVAAPAREGGPERGAQAERTPIVIGHRGAPAYRPEHTLASYELAIAMGADFIEPDVVATKDHMLVARHENEIAGTTDVAAHPEFATRRTTKVIDGRSVTGWFTEDFTLAELRTLRARERLPDLRPANTAFDGRHEIPTFQEVIDLAKRRRVGIYPETKHPSYFDALGLSLEEPLVAALTRSGYRGPNAPVFIQSFEVGNLTQLNRTTQLPLVQLLDAQGAPYDLQAKGDARTYSDLATARGLRAIARYADGVGPSKDLVVPRLADQSLGAPTGLVGRAHRAGLLVHPFTFRPENSFLPANLRAGSLQSPSFQRARGNEEAELRIFYRLGVDGLFTDNPDTAVAVRSKLFRGRRR